jgi:hypothetical protein
MRFRIRTLLILVAIVAIALGGGIWAVRMNRLAREYRARATGFAQSEARSDIRVQVLEERVEYYRKELGTAHQKPGNWKTLNWLALWSLGVFDDALIQARADVAWARTLKLKYQRATWHPWERMRPDPPEPKLPSTSEVWDWYEKAVKDSETEPRQVIVKTGAHRVLSALLTIVITEAQGKLEYSITCQLEGFRSIVTLSDPCMKSPVGWFVYPESLDSVWVFVGDDLYRHQTFEAGHTIEVQTATDDPTLISEAPPAVRDRLPPGFKPTRTVELQMRFREIASMGMASLSVIQP